MASAAIPHFKISLGSLEAGLLLSAFLYGLSTAQLYTYWRSEIEFKDPQWLRYSVYGVWILETIHSAFIYTYFFDVTIAYYMDPTRMVDITWFLAATLVLSAIIGSTVQSITAYRTAMMSGRWGLCYISWSIAFCRLILALTQATLGVRSGTTTEFDSHCRWSSVLLFAADVLGDVIVTGTLCRFLWAERMGLRKRTQRVLDRIIVYVVETGLLTSLTAVVIFTMSQFPQYPGIWVALLAFYCKLYSNSFLAMLNDRRTFRAAILNAESTAGIHVDLESPKLANSGSSTGALSFALPSSPDASHSGSNFPSSS